MQWLWSSVFHSFSITLGFGNHTQILYFCFIFRTLYIPFIPIRSHYVHMCHGQIGHYPFGGWPSDHFHRIYMYIYNYVTITYTHIYIYTYIYTHLLCIIDYIYIYINYVWIPTYDYKPWTPCNLTTMRTCLLVLSGLWNWRGREDILHETWHELTPQKSWTTVGFTRKNVGVMEFNHQKLMSSWDDLAIKQRTLVKHAGLTWFNHLFGIWPMNAMAHRGYDGHILTGYFCWDII